MSDSLYQSTRVGQSLSYYSSNGISIFPEMHKLMIDLPQRPFSFVSHHACHCRIP